MVSQINRGLELQPSGIGRGSGRQAEYKTLNRQRQEHPGRIDADIEGGKELPPDFLAIKLHKLELYFTRERRHASVPNGGG